MDLALAHRLIKLVAESQPQGAILVFLPGWFHITRLQERLTQCAVLGNVKPSLVLPLHSQVRAPPFPNPTPTLGPSLDPFGSAALPPIPPCARK